MILNPQEYYDKYLLHKEFAQISSNGIDVTLKAVKAIIGRGVVGIKEKQLPKYSEIYPITEEEGFFFLPKGHYSLEFNEGGIVPSGYAGIYKTRSTIIRCGAIVESGLFDTGFECNTFGATLFVFNPDGIQIQRNTPIAQLLFMSADEAYKYNGNYQKDKDVK